MRGEGLEKLKKYAWVKQPNNKYTIFDVPIFATFSSKERGYVTEENLKKIVAVFVSEKYKFLRYPRIHIGHHASINSQPGAGYLDNLRIYGGVVFADLVEIPPYVFVDILENKKYPYVSVEYIANEEKISSLALLESQPPFFPFPLLSLTTQPLQSGQFQKNRVCWEQYQVRKLLSYQKDNRVSDTNIKRYQNMEDKKDIPDLAQPQKLDDAVLDGKENLVTPLQELQPQDQIDKKLTSLLEIIPQIKRILDLLESLSLKHAGAEIDQEHEDKEKGVVTNIPENPMSEPSSVAYQSSGYKDVLRQILKKIDILATKNQEHERDKEEKTLERQLFSFCNALGLPYEENLQTLNRFSSVRDKELFLSLLKSSRQFMSAHPATSFAQSFEILSENDALKKYVGKKSDFAVARRAYQSYQDTIAQPNEKAAKRFAAIWPQADKFVDFVVSESAKDPQYLDKMVNG